VNKDEVKSIHCGQFALFSVLIIIVLVSGCDNSPGPEEHSAGPAKQSDLPAPFPGQWERYKPGSLNSLIAEQTPILLKENQGLFVLSPAISFRMKATYLAEEREIDRSKLLFLVSLEKMFARPKFAHLYNKEILFREGLKEYWLPMQEAVLEIVRSPERGLTPGEEVVLYVIWPGCNIQGQEISWFFYVTEYQELR